MNENNRSFEQPQADETAFVLEHARKYRTLGLGLARLRYNAKKPTVRGWTTRSAEPDEFVVNEQIGILLGWPSDCAHPGYSLVCIDLDADAAVAHADEFLPPTGMIEGRAGKPRSHRYYLILNGSIPKWAVSSAPQAAKAAAANHRHAGPAK